MKQKTRPRISLNQSTSEFLTDYAEEHEQSHIGLAIDSIINEYQQLKENQWSLSYVSQSVAHEVQNALKLELKRIRLGTNNTDRNTQILIELMNGHIDFIDCEAILTTDILEVDPLIHARKVVLDRITNQKQKKYNHI